MDDWMSKCWMAQNMDGDGMLDLDSRFSTLIRYRASFMDYVSVTEISGDEVAQEQVEKK